MLGIIILNYLTWQETIKCVDSILDTTKIEIKIYIVDNNSPNNSYEELHKRYVNNKNVVCIKSEENGGFAKGNNIGIHECIKEHIDYALITNNDIIFLEDSIEHMYNVMKEKDAVQLGPKVLSVEKELISPPWCARQSLLQYLHIKSSEKNIIREELTGVHRVYMIPGCCFMVDVQKFVKMGAFDESTFLYNEEGIISMQANRAGYDIMYDGDATVIHNHGASTEKGNLFVDTEVLKSGMYYWKNYECVSNGKIVFIYMFMIARMTIKAVIRSSCRKGYFGYMRDSWSALKNTLKGKVYD